MNLERFGHCQASLLTKQIKSLLSFHFLLLFFSLSLSIFFDKLPYILERAKEIQNLAFVAFIIEN